MSDLHNDAVVIDGLIISNWSRAVFEDMHRGGITAANCTCCVWEGFTDTMKNIGQWNAWFREHDDLILKVRSTADIRRAKAEEEIYDLAPDVEKPDVSWYRPLMDDLTPSKQPSTKNVGTVLLTAAELNIRLVDLSEFLERLVKRVGFVEVINGCGFGGT